MTRRSVDPAVEAQTALAAVQAEALARVEAGRRNHPHDDACPRCGGVAWDVPGDPQQCAACGTRICPVCGADFAEDYATPETGEIPRFDGDRTSDNLGDHIGRWHAGVVL